jgi:chloride channel 7
MRITQVSNDVRMLLPLLVGILVAKWVADAATHPLYHALLEVKCVPWLPSEPPARRALDLVLSILA